MATSEGNQITVEAVIEQGPKKGAEKTTMMEVEPSGQGDAKPAASPGKATADGGGGDAASAAAPEEISEDQLHIYAGHETGKNFPLYEDRKPVGNYEYLDHTADVQLHSWGATLKDSFEANVLAMFDYMTDINCVEKTITKEVEAEGDDLKSLLYHFLDEWLFVFSTDPFFIPREVKITEFDEEKFIIKSTGHGEYFDLVKHPQGTEVKAITYSNMQIHENEKNDIYVIIDI